MPKLPLQLGWLGAVLNRIYIIVGTLAIIILAGAFLVPRFVQWGDYRGRMEELASGVLGTNVTIRGGIDFSLLPQPRLTFSDVLVGDPEEPAATVDAVEADFSLFEFLRDNYNITRLVLRGPVVDFSIDESGFLGTGVAVSGNSGIGLSDATIEDATVRLADQRSGNTLSATDLDGVLRLSGMSGPFAFQGSATYQSLRYAVRFNSGAPDTLGNSAVSASVQSEGGGYSVSTEGVLTPGMAPKFDGTMTYRQAPPAAEAADDIRGNLVFESKVSGSTDRIVLSGYTLQPDENRAGTRLTGAASIQLGMRQSFDAVISGGVFSLPPRDAKEDTSAMPYELVRLFQELPAPLIPPLPGRIGVDLAEMGLRGFALRNLRIDAVTDGSKWTVEQFIADLPGDTELRGAGVLTADGSRPAFTGTFSATTQRLDALVQLWRKPSDANPLFGQAASVDGRVMLAGDAFGINGATLTLAGGTHTAELRLGFGEEQRLDVVAHFAELGSTGSAVVGAMLPALNETGFGNSFPNGSFSLSGATAELFGQSGRDLIAEGHWQPTSIAFTRLSAADWGGVGFDAALNVGGSLATPLIDGSGRLSVANADAGALQALYGLAEVPQAWRDVLARQAPADLLVDIAKPDETGAQVITFDGALAGAQLDLRAELADGIGGLTIESIRLTGTLESDDAAALTEQLALGDGSLFTGDGLMANVGLLGSLAEGMDARINLSSGDERLGYSGRLTAAGWAISGDGTLDLSLADAGGLAQILGANGLSLPMVEASAQLHFESGRLARLTEIAGTSAGTGFSGDLSLSSTAAASAIAGTVMVDEMSFEGLGATLFGRASLVDGAGVWPEGPISIGAQSRSTRGSVNVSAPMVSAGGEARLGETSFELTWDDTRLRLAKFTAAIGEGEVTADLTLCCAGPLAEKTVSGRVSVAGAQIDGIATPAVADMIDGLIDGGVQFEATGASIAEALGTLSGEGNFSIADLAVDGLAPGVYATVAGLEDVLDMDADTLSSIIGVSLGQGAFTAPETTGTFTIAGGVGRLSNLIIEGDGARLAGSVNLTAPTLGLDGSFALTPRGLTDETGLVSEDTARLINRITGTLLTPVATLDVDEMVAAIQVRANEIEVDRLEALRAEDAERQRQAAEERNRLIEEQRQRAAAEAARLAAEEAARLAAEEAARQEELQRQLLLQQQQQQTSPSITTLPTQPLTGPLTLPPVNQSIGAPVNQPL